MLAIAISPDGETIVSGAADGSIQFWEQDGSPKGHRLKAHEGAIATLAISPDGETIASAGEDSTIRLWTIEGDSIGYLEAHQPVGEHKGITSVGFSTDGQTIISAGVDGAVRMSPLDLIRNGGWVGHTCQQLRSYLLVQSQFDEVAREAQRTCQRYADK